MLTPFTHQRTPFTADLEMKGDGIGVQDVGHMLQTHLVDVPIVSELCQLGARVPLSVCHRISHDLVAVQGGKGSKGPREAAGSSWTSGSHQTLIENRKKARKGGGYQDTAVQFWRTVSKCQSVAMVWLQVVAASHTLTKPFVFDILSAGLGWATNRFFAGA